MTIKTPAPDMSTAQHRALTRAARDPRGYVARADGVSSTTLTSLANSRWHWATLEYEILTTPGGQDIKRLCGATITPAGRRDLLLVDAERAQTARDATVRRLGATTRRDPFALMSAAPAPAYIPF